MSRHVQTSSNIAVKADIDGIVLLGTISRDQMIKFLNSEGYHLPGYRFADEAWPLIAERAETDIKALLARIIFELNWNS